MQPEEKMPVRCMGRIFLALCIILFMGCTTQGVPVETGRHTRVRCRPDALSSNCLEEQGERIVIPDGAANMPLPPHADPMVMKKSQEHPDSSGLSEDEYGSGSEMELEPGSGMDDSAEGFAIPDSVLHQSDQDLSLRLTDEGLFLQNERL
ncbi:PREDICTED: serglycin [Gekko japonicus]|uniref:Serglycin n=1 Tax=Gekko japonicus TaxID=146911 RepID=A0ABM1JHZ2_GEKJA|nr:PREDICTED: serglycin [Gekko japonicus]